MAARLNHSCIFFLTAIIISIALPACANNISVKSESNVKLNNTLEKCINIDVIETTLHENIILLKADIRLKTSVGVCGCKSAALQYKVEELNSKIELMSGIFSGLGSRKFSFPIQADRTINQNTDLRLIITCANPQ